MKGSPTPRADIAQTNASYQALLEERKKLLYCPGAAKRLQNQSSTKDKPGFQVLFSGANSNPNSHIRPKSFISPEKAERVPPKSAKSRPSSSKWSQVVQPITIKHSDGDDLTLQLEDSHFDASPSSQSPLPPLFLDRVLALPRDKLRILLNTLQYLEEDVGTLKDAETSMENSYSLDLEPSLLSEANETCHDVTIADVDPVCDDQEACYFADDFEEYDPNDSVTYSYSQLEGSPDFDPTKSIIRRASHQESSVVFSMDFDPTCSIDGSNFVLHEVPWRS
ncbi:hypothetical protein RCL1_008334 [Eukaryota sp. TZLM3-RCL]